MKRYLLSAVVVYVALVSQVMAKEGLYAGLFIPTSSISGGGLSGTNTGWGLRVGNGFNRYFAIEGNKTAVPDLNGYALDLKINFPLTTLDSAQIMSLEPYALVGYDYFELNESSKLKGSGIQYGVGIELYLFRELSVNAGWTKSAASFDSTPKTDGTITTIDFGVLYHFI